MMNVAIDPSEARTSQAPGPSPTKSKLKSKLRLVLVGGLAVSGVAAFSTASMSLLGSLAGPPPKPIARVSSAASWPDLKDGVPALATGSVARDTAPSPAPAPATLIAPTPEAPAPLRAALDTEAQPVTPSPVPSQRASAAPAKRAPMIENAATLKPTREAALVSTIRTVHSLAPTRAETVKARSTDATFAALPAAPAAVAEKEVEKDPVREPAREAAKPRPKIVAAKPIAAKKAEVASAEAVPAATAEEPETTEVFGLKVPSLAPAGRRIRESVEALGDAVKGLPEKF